MRNAAIAVLALLALAAVASAERTREHEATDHKSVPFRGGKEARAADFAAADTDKSGSLSKDEFLAFATDALVKHMKTRRAMPGRTDARKEKVASARAQKRASGMFLKMDVDMDQQLSEEEVVNHEKVLKDAMKKAREEHRAAHKAERAEKSKARRAGHDHHDLAERRAEQKENRRKHREERQAARQHRAEERKEKASERREAAMARHAAKRAAIDAKTWDPIAKAPLAEAPKAEEALKAAPAAEATQADANTVAADDTPSA